MSKMCRKFVESVPTDRVRGDHDFYVAQSSIVTAQIFHVLINLI